MLPATIYLGYFEVDQSWFRGVVTVLNYEDILLLGLRSRSPGFSPDGWRFHFGKGQTTRHSHLHACMHNKHYCMKWNLIYYAITDQKQLGD